LNNKILSTLLPFNCRALLCCYILLFTPLPLYAAPFHTITVDGNLSDWAQDEEILRQGNALYNPAESSDSAWDPATGKNELKRLLMTWDKQNLYIGLEGATDNSGLLLYIDVDSKLMPGGDAGTDNLYYISTWNRKVKFAVYKPDFFYGAWSGSSGNLYKITSSSSVSDVSSYSSISTGKTSAVPGYEIRIPWEVLYGLNKENVPAGARIALFASLCTGDIGSELYSGATIQFGYLGGDCIPDSSGNNIFTFAPSTVTDFAVMDIDSDDNGVPDDKLSAGALSILNDAIENKVFSPYGIYSSAKLSVKLNRQSSVTVKIYDINGNLVSEPVTNSYVSDLNYSWNGKDGSGNYVKAGVYIFNFRADSGTGDAIRKNYSIAVIK